MKHTRTFWQKLTRREKWNVGILSGQYEDLLRPGFSLSGIVWLPEQRGNYIADPFVFYHSGVHYIFFEEFHYLQQRGRLGYIIVRKTESGFSFSNRKYILDAPFHQSYPNIFEYEGKIYCLPEEGAAHHITLYECIQFPDKWRKCKTLVNDFPGLDATLWHDMLSDTWWMFGTKLGSGGENSDLYAWIAPSLFGPWKPHVNNPIKRDIANARSAGSIFTNLKEIIRPAQNSSVSYGSSLVLNKIERFNDLEFSEKRMGEVLPDPAYPFGVHHVSYSSGILAFDGKRAASPMDAILDHLGCQWKKYLKL